MANNIEDVKVIVKADASQFKSEMKGVTSDLRSVQNEIAKFSSSVQKGFSDVRATMEGIGYKSNEMSGKILDSVSTVGGASKKMGGAVGGAMETAGSSMAKMGAIAGAVGGLVATAVQKVIQLIGKLISKLKELTIMSTNFAINAYESETLVARVFGDGTQEIVAWSEELSEAFGLNAYDMRKYAATLYTISDSLGLTSRQALTLSKSLAQLSVDMSAFYNIDIEDAFTKLRSGITGETEPLRKLGIIITQQMTKMSAYKHGIAEVGEELSEQQKVLARYMTIMEQTSIVQGAWGDELQNPAAQLRILGNRLKMVAINFGSIFIPILQRTLPYLQALVSLLADVINKLMSLFGIIGVNVDRNLSALESGFGDVGDKAEGAAGGVSKLKKELLGLAAFDEMNVLKQPDNSGSGGSGGGGGIGSFSDFELPEYDFGFDQILDKANELKAKIKAAFEEMLEPILAITTALGVMLAVMSGGTLLTVVGVIMAVVGAFTLLWTVSEKFRSGVTFLGEQLGALVGGAFGTFKQILLTIWDILRPFVVFIGDILGSVFTALGYILEPIIERVRAIGIAFEWMREKLEPVMEAVSGRMEILGAIIGGLIETFGALVGGIMDTLSPFDELILAERDNEIASKDLETAQKDLKQAQDDLTVVTGNLADAELALIDAEKRQKEATEQHTIALNSLNKMKEEGKQGTKEYEEAEELERITKLKLESANGRVQSSQQRVTDQTEKQTVAQEKVNDEIENGIDATNRINESQQRLDSKGTVKWTDRIKDAFGDMGDKINSIWDDVWVRAKSGLNKVIDVYNRLRNKVNGVKLPFGAGTIELPYIHPLATGGVVSSPTLSMIGEAGAEAVLPLENNTQWMDLLADKINGNGGDMHLTVKIGEDKIIDKIVSGMNDKSLRTGVNLLNI